MSGVGCLGHVHTSQRSAINIGHYILVKLAKKQCTWKMVEINEREDIDKRPA